LIENAVPSGGRKLGRTEAAIKTGQAPKPRASQRSPRCRPARNRQAVRWTGGRLKPKLIAGRRNALPQVTIVQRSAAATVPKAQ